MRRRRGAQNDQAPVPANLVSVQRVDVWRGEQWVVRPVPGGQAVKAYRCPGCEQEVGLGQPHVVVWPDGRSGGADDRRHWHTPCWSARDRRGPR